MGARRKSVTNRLSPELPRHLNRLRHGGSGIFGFQPPIGIAFCDRVQEPVAGKECQKTLADDSVVRVRALGHVGAMLAIAFDVLRQGLLARRPVLGNQPRIHQLCVQIVAEVRQLAAEGCKEVCLLGQTVNSYQYDLGDGRRVRLSDLLARIHDTNGIERIKFITNFPRDMSDDLLDAVRALPRVSPYLHVPAQSGCNEVLRRMKRL